MNYLAIFKKSYKIDLGNLSSTKTAFRTLVRFNRFELKSRIKFYFYHTDSISKSMLTLNPSISDSIICALQI